MPTRHRAVLAAATAVTALAVPESGRLSASGPPPEPAPLGAVCSAIPEGLSLVIPYSGGVVAATAGAAEFVEAPIAAGPNLAARGPDGTVWVEATPGGHFGVYRIAPGSEAALVVEGNASLTGIGWFGGRSAAAVLDANGQATPDDPDGFGAVLVDGSDGQQANLGPAGAWEYGVRSATLGGGAAVIAGVGEAVESFGVLGPSGEPVDWYSFSERQSDIEPGYWWPAATIDPATSAPVLGWAEQHQRQEADGTWVSSWQLAVVDAATGDELRRVDLGDAGEALVHADLDGSFWVGTFADALPEDFSEPEPSRIVAVDLSADAPAGFDVGCPPLTTATIDRLGAIEPPAPPAAPPPTTTTEVGRCSEYVEEDWAYPVERCEKGWHVTLVQMMLTHLGYGVDVDSYFGPQTERAVRDFQRGAGVEVDGLVGPDTFSALVARVPPLARDSDGSGTIDPWEFPLDCTLTLDPDWYCANESAAEPAPTTTASQ
jgi:peptidoglycan hydrolase-like protein with peptidoglycan-binding domain